VPVVCGSRSKVKVRASLSANSLPEVHLDRLPERSLYSTGTAMFVAVVDPSMVNVIEDPPSYFISIRQLSLPVDFRHFFTYQSIRT